MQDYEYITIPLTVIPQEIVNHYKLTQIVHNNKVYIKICCSMYGLLQAGILAEKVTWRVSGKVWLLPSQSHPMPMASYLVTITFCLFVDDFGVKCVGMVVVDTEREGKCFCSIKLSRDNGNQTCDLSMPGYIKEDLHCFQHPSPKQSQDSRYPTQQKQYGTSIQLTDPIDTTTCLPAHEVR